MMILPYSIKRRSHTARYSAPRGAGLPATSPWTSALMLGAALLIALLTATPAWSCAVCQCGDPTLSLMGTAKPFEGRLRLSAEAQLRQERFGSPELGQQQTLTDQRLQLRAAWAPRPWLFLNVSTPLVRRTLTHPNLAQDLTMNLGDVEAGAKIFLWQERPSRPRWMAGITAGLTAPTAVRQRGADGSFLDVDAQAGFGAWIPNAGLWISHYRFPWSFHLSSAVHAPGQGWDQLNPGVSWLQTFAAQLQPWTWLGASLSLDGRVSQRDVFAGQVDADSGGTLVTLSPGLVWSPSMDLIVHATVRIPIVDALYGDHDEGPIFITGVTLDL